MKTPSYYDIEEAVNNTPSIESFTADYTPGRNSIRVASPFELEAALINAIRLTRSYDESKDSAEFLRRTVEHEMQHDKAARAVGAQVLGYGLHFFDGGSKLFAFHQTKPLGVPILDAAIELYPEEPSTHDKSRAEKLGFPSVEAFATAAHRHNGEHGTTIPIPLSYNPKATRTFV